MAEWLKAHAWKACIGATLSRVRIPLPPPDAGRLECFAPDIRGWSVLSGSEALPQLIAMLWLRFGPYMRLLSDLVARQLDDGVIHPYSTYHYEMIDAFKAGDGKRAGALMASDIGSTQKLLQALC